MQSLLEVFPACLQHAHNMLDFRALFDLRSQHKLNIENVLALKLIWTLFFTRREIGEFERTSRQKNIMPEFCKNSNLGFSKK